MSLGEHTFGDITELFSLIEVSPSSNRTSTLKLDPGRLPFLFPYSSSLQCLGLAQGCLKAINELCSDTHYVEMDFKEAS